MSRMLISWLFIELKKVLKCFGPSGMGIPPSGPRLTEPLCLCGPGLSKDTTQVHTLQVQTRRSTIQRVPLLLKPWTIEWVGSHKIETGVLKDWAATFGIRTSESSRASGRPDTHWSDLDFNLGSPKVFLLHQSIGRPKSIWGTALFFGSGCGSLGILNMLLKIKIKNKFSLHLWLDF